MYFASWVLSSCVLTNRIEAIPARLDTAHPDFQILFLSLRVSLNVSVDGAWQYALKGRFEMPLPRSENLSQQRSAMAFFTDKTSALISDTVLLASVSSSNKKEET